MNSIQKHLKSLLQGAYDRKRTLINDEKWPEPEKVLVARKQIQALNKIIRKHNNGVGNLRRKKFAKLSTCFSKITTSIFFDKPEKAKKAIDDFERTKY